MWEEAQASTCELIFLLHLALLNHVIKSYYALNCSKPPVITRRKKKNEMEGLGVGRKRERGVEIENI